MPAIFDLLYHEYCRARLAEMRKQLRIMRQSPDGLEADHDLADQDGAGRQIRSTKFVAAFVHELKL